MLIHPDRLFPAEPAARDVARRLYADVQDLPIISPHGHTDPRWYAENEPFPDPATLFVIPDHYIFRMLYSQGVRLEDLGIADEGRQRRRDAIRARSGVGSRRIIISSAARRRGLARPYLRDAVRLHRAALGRQCRCLLRPDRRGPAHAGIPAARAVRALPHRGDRHDGKPARSAEAPRDHPSIRLERPRGHGLSSRSGRRSRIRGLPRRTSCASARSPAAIPSTWNGYLEAHRKRRAFFREYGATSTDHGHPTARTADLSQADAEALFRRVSTGDASRERCGAVPRPDADRDGGA